MKIILGILFFIAPIAAWSMIKDSQPADGEGEAAPDTLPPESFLEGIGIMAGKTTRGERNNNPGNIRKSAANWQGKVAGTDSAFETFATPQDGIRALAVTLKNYQIKYGLNTVAGIINRWAPSIENNTGAYIRAVSAAVGVEPNDRIDLNNASTLYKLVKAIINHENGRVIYAGSTIAQGIALA